MITPITVESSTRFSYNPLGQRRSIQGFMSKRVIRVGDPTNHCGRMRTSGALHSP